MPTRNNQALGLIIPIFLVLSGCAGPNLEEDPRTSKLAALVDGKYNDAVKGLDQALSRDPNSLVAQYLRGSLEVERGNPDDGVNRLTKLIDRYPRYSFAYSERSRAYWKIGQYDKALADANLAIHYKPNVSRNYIRRASAYIEIHKDQEALADLATAQKLDPLEGAPRVRLLIARAQMDKGQYQQALPVLDDAVAKRKDDVRPYIDRALCYARLNDLARATADSSKALKLQPDNVDAKVLQAALLSASGQRHDALALMQVIIKAPPPEKQLAEMCDLGSSSSSVADMAQACLAAKNPKLAKAILTLVESKRPLEPEELFVLARAFIVENDRFRAAKLLNQCLATEPTWGAPRVELIKLYAKDNLPQKALEVQKEGLKLPLSAKDRKQVAAAI